MKVFCYGASGHGKVVADILALRGMELLTFVDDNAAKAGTCLAGIPVSGPDAALRDLLAEEVAAIVSIGWNQVRSAKAAELDRLGFKFTTAVHPAAAVARDTMVGAGTVIMAGAVVNSGSRIGAHAIINTGAIVDHDCTLAEGVHVSPGASLAGGVVVGANAHIGIRASVIPSIQIGADAIIGAGAVVIRDVPAGVAVVGSPARILNPANGMTPNKSQVFVGPEQSILETLQVIDKSGLAIALVVDRQRHLLGTVTDGDVRRAILHGTAVGAPVSSIMNRSPTTVTPAQDLEQIRRLLLASTLKHVPVVDQENRVLDLITVAELLSVPMSVPDIADREIEDVLGILRARSHRAGSKGVDFEQKIAAYANCRYAVAVSSGGAGLHLLVRALGFGPGDEVITTPFSYSSATNCLLRENVLPRFVDIDPRTCNLSAERLEAAITPRTKAILAVDIFGQPADYDRIREIAARRGLCFLIDACQSIGAEYRRRRASSHGVAAVFGFQEDAQITTGEGGAIVTSDSSIADRCRHLRDQGCNHAVEEEAGPDLPGYDYRLGDLNSAVGLAQLDRIDEILEQRRQLAELYDGLLEGLAEVHRPYVAPETTRMSWFAYVVRLSEKFGCSERDQVIARLRDDGIGVGRHGIAIHLQPLYRQRFGFHPGNFPIAEAVADRTLALPFHHHLLPGDVAWVVERLSSVLASIAPRRETASAASGVLPSVQGM